MPNKILFTNIPITPNKPSTGQQIANSQKNSSVSFDEILQSKVSEDIKFSQHAMQRLQSRNINISQADMAKLQNAVDKAAQKGAKESLILMQDVALVVSIKNKTVITAVDGANLKENVFTNIDSAVIV